MYLFIKLKKGNIVLSITQPLLIFLSFLLKIRGKRVSTLRPKIKQKSALY